MAQKPGKAKFGTGPVFFTAISTILGAIMFLRFGYAVGTVGFWGTIGIILIGHMVTIPTAMAIAEIATNQRVEGGGEYYIISRSFGLVIGSTIGIALYLSQAISVAFYIMAFSEAFNPLIKFVSNQFILPEWLDWLVHQKQAIGIPALVGLMAIVLTKGADLGVKALYVVVATLALSMVAFFAGQTEYQEKIKQERRTIIETQTRVSDTLESRYEVDQGDSLISEQDVLLPIQQEEGKKATFNQPKLSPAPPIQPEPKENRIPEVSFFAVFAIIFPAFTGMTAGVGLSGDLKEPGKSIPLGTLAGTVVGMITYFFIAWKLYISAPASELADTSRLIMAEIAWQGWWIIPTGLAAATISSALGSIMVAPRTLQAIAKDQIFPVPTVNRWLSRGKGINQEPFNASIVTIVVAAAFIMAGALDSVAEVISMFFMVTYGSLCLISFLNHFAADPSYRPRFRSYWFISLAGAVGCFGLMFFMNSTYAIISLIMIGALYLFISYYNRDKKSIALIFQGVIFQLSRRLQVFLQKADKEKTSSWRPSAIAISEKSFERFGAFDLLRWISQKYGFGTYIHQINGYLSRQTNEEAHKAKDRLIKMAENSESNIYVDTLISPSYTSSIANVIQLPGIAGTENNLILFEFSKAQEDHLSDIVDNFKLIKSVNFDVAILASSERGFGHRREIHIWITSADYENANLMILLAYILLGHSDWKRAEIKIFAIYPDDTCSEERKRLFGLIETGQLPISTSNIKVIAQKSDLEIRQVIYEKSVDADLTILGFRHEVIKKKGGEVFLGYEGIGNVLFVNAAEQKEIK